MGLKHSIYDRNIGLAAAPPWPCIYSKNEYSINVVASPNMFAVPNIELIMQRLYKADYLPPGQQQAKIKLRSETRLYYYVILEWNIPIQFYC